MEDTYRTTGYKVANEVTPGESGRMEEKVKEEFNPKIEHVEQGEHYNAVCVNSCVGSCTSCTSNPCTGPSPCK